MRSLGVLLLVFSVSACGRSAAPGDDAPEPTPTPQGDELTFAAMLAGEIPAAEGLALVDEGGGWPIATDTGYVFVRLDEGRGPWSLAGDHDAWAGAAMQEAPGGFWWARVEIGAAAGSKYKFVDGDGTFEADPMARRFGYDAFGEYSLVDAAGEHLQRFSAVTDGTVAPRTIRVRVPAGAVTRHLYVHDGQNLFDPAAPFGGWRLEESLGPGTLAIGIDNTAARMDEYTHVADDLGGGPVGGAGDAYADFVQQTVRPLIEQRFGTPSTVGTMGSSLGGLISFHLALRHDGEWDFAASLSGTMGWGSLGANNQTMIERWTAAGHRSTRLYLDSGGGPGSGCVDSDADGIQDDAPDESDNYCTNRQLADALDAAGYDFDVDLWHWHEPGAAHDEAAWAARVFRPIGIFEAL